MAGAVLSRNSLTDELVAELPSGMARSIATALMKYSPSGSPVVSQRNTPAPEPIEPICLSFTSTRTSRTPDCESQALRAKLMTTAFVFSGTSGLGGLTTGGVLSSRYSPRLWSAQFPSWLPPVQALSSARTQRVLRPSRSCAEVPPDQPSEFQ